MLDFLIKKLIISIFLYIDIRSHKYFISVCPILWKLNKKDPHRLIYLNVGPHLVKYFGKALEALSWSRCGTEGGL